MLLSNTKKIAAIFTMSFLIVPLFVYAATPAPTPLPAATEAPNTGITYECVQKEAGAFDPVTGKKADIYGNCSFNNVIAATKKITNFGARFALMFSVVVIAYAGFRYMVSGDNASERKKANEMLWKVLLGMVWILAAWLLITLITNALLSTEVASVVPLGAN